MAAHISFVIARAIGKSSLGNSGFNMIGISIFSLP
jgi:hypothetical protein